MTNLTQALSQRIQCIKPSPTLSIANRAEELQANGIDIINLSVGEPDFDTPLHIKEAAIKAIQEGHTKYTAVDGIKSLKQAIINKFSRENHLRYELNQILVSCGAKHSLFNLFMALLNPGDEVIIPAPYWVSYPDIVMLADGKPINVPTQFEEQFKLTPLQLEKAITPKTRAFILNSPANPTGIAYTRAELKGLSQVLLKYPQVLIVTDDIYEHNLWNELPFQNILNVCEELYDRCVIINGVSKAYAMTGWRIGYAAGPAAIIAAMRKIQSQSTSCPTSISQYAAETALNGDQSCIVTMTSAYKLRHDYVFATLKSIPGINCLPADGTFYSFPSIKAIIKQHPRLNDDLDFAEYLLTEAKLAIIPGSAFGLPNHIRISYATNMDNLILGMDRFKSAIDKLFR